MSDLTFIGVPYWLGEKTRYTGSVERVLASGIVQEFDAQWLDIAPQFSPDEKPVISVNRALAAAIQQTLASDRVPLLVVGDCTCCLGAMKGLEALTPDVLWYDAHGDFNTPEISPSGFLGGMPLAAMVGMGNQDLMQGIDLDPIDASRIVLTDGRDLDPEEAILVQNSALVHLPDFAALARHAWSAPVYIHFDTDVIRLEDLPAVSYPAAGGPSVQDARESVRSVIQQADVCAVLFTLWNNQLVGAEQSYESTLSVIRAVCEELRH